MLFKPFAITLVGSAALCGTASAGVVRDVVDGMLPRDSGNLNYRHNHRRGELSERQAVATNCLDPQSVQTGSASTGQAAVVDPGQINSATYVIVARYFARY